MFFYRFTELTSSRQTGTLIHLLQIQLINKFKWKMLSASEVRAIFLQEYKNSRRPLLSARCCSCVLFSFEQKERYGIVWDFVSLRHSTQHLKQKKATDEDVTDTSSNPLIDLYFIGL